MDISFKCNYGVINWQGFTCFSLFYASFRFPTIQFFKKIWNVTSQISISDLMEKVNFLSLTQVFRFEWWVWYLLLDSLQNGGFSLLCSTFSWWNSFEHKNKHHLKTFCSLDYLVLVKDSVYFPISWYLSFHSCC